MTKYTAFITFYLFQLFLASNNENLTDGIFEIKYKDLYLNIHHKNNNLFFSKKSPFQTSSFFRIKNVLDKENNSFFLIESLKHNGKFYSKKNLVIINFIYEKSDDNFLWLIIKKNENYSLIRNKNGCYIKLYNLNKIICNDSVEEESQLFLIKIYEEVNHSQEDLKLIEKEPIDVLIKYIDLTDKNLNRKGIHQIAKDLDNEELRYSIRSILKNLPWIRKIFILMPNEKVSYLKEIEEIKEKIVYVKDKDLIGFDSSSSLVFQFRYWKMKDFNLSDNFISMDDDCYIGRPLKKSDLFYVKDKKVVPLIITSKFLTFYKEEVERKIYYYKKNIKKSKREQTFIEFQYSKQLTYSFIMDVLSKKKIIVPKFTHNAIPTNVYEIKEIYDLISESKFKNTTLYSNYRHIDSLQFQTFILGYTFIKHKKKIKNISHKLIGFGNTLFSKYNYDLFCVNTNSHQNTILSKKIFKIVMENLFPKESPYEIINYSLSSLSMKIIKEMVKRNDYLKKKLDKKNKEKIKFLNLSLKYKKEKEDLTKVLFIPKKKLKMIFSRKKYFLYIFLVLILLLILKNLYNSFYIKL